ncbi:cache domain-containing protein, partial [bacterium]|nr:cache domain-containing protein [bacterium]
DIYSLRKIKYGEYNDRLNAGKRSFEASLDRLSNRVRTIASNRSTRHPLVTALKNNESIDLLLQKSSSPRQLGTGAMMIVAGKDSIMAFSSEQYEPDIFESLKQYIIKTDTAYSGLGILHSKNNNFVGVIGVAPIHVITDREMYFLQIIQIGNGFCDEFKETTGVNSTIWIQEQRYATSDIDKDGNRILDVVTGADIIKKVLGLGKTVTVHTDLLSKRDFALISPLKDLSGGRVGMFGVGINANELASEQRRLIFENILIEFIIFVIVILISIIISKKLTTPLVEFHKMATSISVGNYNLPEFAITGKDELNSLKKSFNRMLYEIREREARELEFKRNQALRLSELTVLNDIATEINVNQ